MTKRQVYIFSSFAVFLFVLLYLYNGIDSGQDMMPKRQAFVDDLRKKIGDLEATVKNNGKTIDRLEDRLKEAQQAAQKAEKSVDFDDKGDEKIEDNEKGDELVVRGNRIAHVHQMQQHTKSTRSMANVCSIRENISSPKTSLQMLDLYNSWKFENVDGGVWKQGFEITYDKVEVQKQPKLEVIVMPSSHCDPGWLMTFEEYYTAKVKNILDLMIVKLEEQPEMRYSYAEMSFFELWWKDQTATVKDKVKKYIKEGRFEIITGGWVMTDEANAHYYSMLTELFEGHEFILNHLGRDAIPTAHWSIDPFGLSPSFPHLLTSANISDGVIQRVHYSVKREFSLKKQLEFKWQQLFGETGHGDMRTLMMPFYSYDQPHTCGPEPAVCCQFDFRRQPTGDMSCPWGIAPRPINSNNVAERAAMLYDQYRKKAQLYAHNTVFIPLVDDFRFNTEFEWNEQYKNYKQLFDHMNSNEEMNVHVKFGTLSDYFKVLDDALKRDSKELPTLSGDFFTYADRDDHYWSGYFTSRPFYKQLDRVLQHYLRSAEIAFSLANIEEEGAMDKKVFEKLVVARRAHSLFQHHDGVTGTSKTPVMTDYGNKMIEALSNCEEVLSESLVVLLGIDSASKMVMDEKRDNNQLLPSKRVYSIGNSVVMFNTLSRNRNEPVCIYVDSISAGIEGVTSIDKQQISPAFKYDEENKKLVVIEDIYELCFSTNFGSMEAASYRIVKDAKVEKVKVMTNLDRKALDSSFQSADLPSDITIDNGKVKATFDSKDGMIKTTSNFADGKTIDVNAQFVHYTARQSKGRFANGNQDNPPGAYLFLPASDAKKVEKKEAKIVVIDGGLVKRVIATPTDEFKVLQTYTMYDKLDWIDIDTEVDVREKKDYELAIRLESNVNSGDDFYTDLNGMQMIKRTRQSKLPTQANFYPMSAGVYIEDQTTRLSIHSAQALGVSSLASGQIEIMLDRTMRRDDVRGLEQGVEDNKRTVSHFRMVVEPMENGGHQSSERVGFHSSVGYMATWSLHYPIIKMIAESIPKALQSKSFDDELNCDLHVVTFRSSAQPTKYEQSDRLTMAEQKAALVVHRVVPDCRSKLQLADQSCLSADFKINPKKLISLVKSSKSTTLTGLYDGEKMDEMELKPNEISTILVSW